MKEKEFEILEDIVNLHNKYIKLEVQHPADNEEWCKAIHDLQKIIALRFVRYDYPEIFLKKVWQLKIPKLAGSNFRTLKGNFNIPLIDETNKFIRKIIQKFTGGGKKNAASLVWRMNYLISRLRLSEREARLANGY